MSKQVVLYEPLTDCKLYEGEVVDGKKHGYGKLYYVDYENPRLRYVGQFQKDNFHGYGTLFNRNGDKIYEGEWKNGLYDGFGTLYDEGSLVYRGQFRKGLVLDEYESRKSGFHKEYYTNGVLKYEGQWKEGLKNGLGKGYWEDGTLWYEGEFKDDQPHGYGKMFYRSGQLRYEGQLVDMQFVGWGKEYYENGHLKFEGIHKKSMYFFYGARCYVFGKLYYPDGKLRYEGTFKGLKSYEFDKGVEFKPGGEVVWYGK